MYPVCSQYVSQCIVNHAAGACLLALRAAGPLATHAMPRTQLARSPRTLCHARSCPFATHAAGQHTTQAAGPPRDARNWPACHARRTSRQKASFESRHTQRPVRHTLFCETFATHAAGLLATHAAPRTQRARSPRTLCHARSGPARHAHCATHAAARSPRMQRASTPRT